MRAPADRLMGMRQRSINQALLQPLDRLTPTTLEMNMNTKRLLAASIAVLALSPFAAFADAGDEESKQWLASLQSTRTVEEVRAEARNLPLLGQLHPVEVQPSAPSTLSRDEVRAELARYGVPQVGA
jgi:hypothetical protein